MIEDFGHIVSILFGLVTLVVQRKIFFGMIWIAIFQSIECILLFSFANYCKRHERSSEPKIIDFVKIDQPIGDSFAFRRFIQKIQSGNEFLLVFKDVSNRDLQMSWQ